MVNGQWVHFKLSPKLNLINNKKHFVVKGSKALSFGEGLGEVK